MDKRFIRSLDFYTKEEFKIIQNTRILVAGVGGMGGVCAELLIRMGYINLTIADFDHFDITNINRQIYCNEKMVGKNKAEVLKKQFKLMNPNVKIKILKEGITDSNRSELMKNHDIIVNGIDNPAHSILLRREAYQLKKPMVDAWLTPAVCCFTVNPNENIDPEEFMGYPTKHLKTSKDFTLDIKKECLKIDIEYTKKRIYTDDIISENIINDIINYKYQRHFPTMVWMCGCLMATEVFKLTLKKGTPAPLSGVFLNYLDYNFIK